MMTLQTIGNIIEEWSTGSSGYPNCGEVIFIGDNGKFYKRYSRT